MRRLSTALLLVACCLDLFAQDEAIDSLNAVLRSTIPDTSRVSTLIALSGQFSRVEREHSRRLAIQAKELAERTGHKSGLARAYKAIE